MVIERIVVVSLVVACSCGGGSRPIQPRGTDSGAAPDSPGAHGGSGGVDLSGAGGTGASSPGGTGGNDAGLGGGGAGGRIDGDAGSSVDGGTSDTGDARPCVGSTAQACCLAMCTSGCCVFVGNLNRTEWQCVARGDACPNGGTCEADNACSDCGGVGKPCCGSFANEGLPWCGMPATTCVRDTTGMSACTPCGGMDQPCCLTVQAFPVGRCDSPLQCNGQMCGPRA
jgi:hypothetical protein